MRILIAGAGAMGARFGYMLYAHGQEVVFADYWTEHVQAINEKGLQAIIDGQTLQAARIPAYTPNEVSGSFDLVIVFTKAMQLKTMLSDISHVFEDDTALLCLLNGLGHLDNLRLFIRDERLYLGTTIWSSALAGPGVVKGTGTGAISFQQIKETSSPITSKILDVLNEAELNATCSQNVMQTIWHKASVNCVLNTCCTLIDCTVGGYGSYVNNEALTSLILDEIVEVGAAEGVIVEKENVMQHLRDIIPPDKVGLHYPSLYQDIKNNRPTEVDYLTGAIVRLGQKHGIQTPVCEALTHMILAKEAVLNIGK